MPRANASAASCLSISGVSSTRIVIETSYLYPLSDGCKRKSIPTFICVWAARSPVRPYLAAARLLGTHFSNEPGHIGLSVALRVAACRIFAQFIQRRSRLLRRIGAEGFTE